MKNETKRTFIHQPGRVEITRARAEDGVLRKFDMNSTQKTSGTE